MTDGLVESIIAEIAAYDRRGLRVIAVMAAPDVCRKLPDRIMDLPVEEHDEWSWGWAPRLGPVAIRPRPPGGEA